MKRAGTLKVSKNIWAATSRLLRGFNGASVRRTGCYPRGTLSRKAKRAQGGVDHLFAEGAELLCIDVAPDALHVVPVCHDAVFHRILDFEEATELLGASADEDVALESARHDADVFGAADAGRER